MLHPSRQRHFYPKQKAAGLFDASQYSADFLCSSESFYFVTRWPAGYATGNGAADHGSTGARCWRMAGIEHGRDNARSADGIAHIANSRPAGTAGRT
jgi:hypothetical protein